VSSTGTPQTAIQLTWQPTSVDYVEASSARTQQDKVMAAMFALFLVGVAVMGVALYFGSPELVLLGVAVAAVPIFKRPVIVRANTIKLWLNRPELRAPVHAVVYPDAGIELTGPILDIRTPYSYVDGAGVVQPWQRITQVLETEGVFVVHLAPKVFFLLAKRGVTDPQALPTLRALLMR
jgi:hypothetical protein